MLADGFALASHLHFSNSQPEAGYTAVKSARDAVFAAYHEIITHQGTTAKFLWLRLTHEKICCQLSGQSSTPITGIVALIRCRCGRDPPSEVVPLQQSFAAIKRR